MYILHHQDRTRFSYLHAEVFISEMGWSCAECMYMWVHQLELRAYARYNNFRNLQLKMADFYCGL